MYLEFFIHYYMYIGVNLEYFLWLGGYLKGINALVSFPKKNFLPPPSNRIQSQFKRSAIFNPMKEGDTYYFRLFLFSIAEIYQHFAKKKSQSYLFLKMYRGIYYILTMYTYTWDGYYTFQKTALLLLQTYYIYVNYAHNYEFMILLKQKWLAATAGVFLCSCIEKSHMHFKGVGINRYLYDKS